METMNNDNNLGKLLFPQIEPKDYKPRHTHLIELFSSTAFYGGWVALSDYIIQQYTAIRRKSKNAIDNFIRCTLKRYYRYNEDYKQIDYNSIYIRKYNESGWASTSFFGHGEPKRNYFAVSRECLIDLVQKKKYKPLKGIPNERKVKTKLAELYNGRVDARFHFGIVDVLTKTEVIFVRRGSKWSNAVGHALTASLYFEDISPHIHLFDTSEKRKVEIEAACKLLSVKCTFEGDPRLGRKTKNTATTAAAETAAAETAAAETTAQSNTELRQYLIDERIKNTVTYLADYSDAQKREIISRLLTDYICQKTGMMKCELNKISANTVDLLEFKGFCSNNKVCTKGQSKLKSIVRSILSHSE